MTNFIRSLLVALIFSLGFSVSGFVSTAFADEKCKTTSTACSESNRVANQPSVNGPKSNARADACVRILTDRETEILMFAGDFSGGRQITGKPIKTQRPTSGHYEKRSGVKVVEFCFSKSTIANLKAFTICNGRTKSEGARHIIKGTYLSRLKKTGHVGDYLTLLGSSSYKKYGHIFTASDYRRRYGG